MAEGKIIRKGGAAAAGGLVVSSRQKGSFTLIGGSDTLPITPVDLTKSIIKSRSYRGTDTDSGRILATCKFQDASTLSFQKDDALGWSYNTYEVIEFESVKSLQSGSFNSTATQYDVTLTTAVNELNSDVYFSIRTPDDGSERAMAFSAQIINSTTVRFYFYSSFTYNVEWFVIESE